MHKVLVNRLGGLSLPRKSVVRLIHRPDMALDVYHGRKQQKSTIIREDVMVEEVCECGVVERGWSYIRKLCTV